MIANLTIELLNSKESECRTGALNILGSICGLGYDFEAINISVKTHLEFFRRLENLISANIWEIVFNLQSDWDTTN